MPKQPKKPIKINLTRLSEHTGLTRVTVRKYKANGVFLDTDSVNTATKKIIQFLINSHATKTANIEKMKKPQDMSERELDIEYKRQRVRVEKHTADKLKLFLRKERNELVNYKVVETLFVEVVAKFKSKILALPSMLSPSLIATNDFNETHDILEDSLTKALDELSNTELPDDMQEITENENKDDDTND